MKEYMTRKYVNYNVIYKGLETIDLEPGKVYKCVAEVYDENNQLHDLAIIDESGEDYLYSPDDFDVLK